jgi:hypothetical protein
MRGAAQTTDRRLAAAYEAILSKYLPGAQGTTPDRIVAVISGATTPRAIFPTLVAGLKHQYVDESNTKASVARSDVVDRTSVDPVGSVESGLIPITLNLHGFNKLYAYQVVRRLCLCCSPNSGYYLTFIVGKGIHSHTEPVLGYATSGILRTMKLEVFRGDGRLFCPILKQRISGAESEEVAQNKLSRRA